MRTNSQNVAATGGGSAKGNPRSQGSANLDCQADVKEACTIITCGKTENVRGGAAESFPKSGSVEESPATKLVDKTLSQLEAFTAPGSDTPLTGW